MRSVNIMTYTSLILLAVTYTIGRLECQHGRAHSSLTSSDTTPRAERVQMLLSQHVTRHTFKWYARPLEQHNLDLMNSKDLPVQFHVPNSSAGCQKRAASEILLLDKSQRTRQEAIGKGGGGYCKFRSETTLEGEIM
ncbi:hypothetical protein BgiMline_015614 [Biomphalaria glabrata]|nr:hypothetical protein BgiMline_008434 [Biomphalaria glabrata]